MKPLFLTILTLLYLLILLTSCAQQQGTSFLGVDRLSWLSTSHENTSDSATSEQYIEQELRESTRDANPEYQIEEQP